MYFVQRFHHVEVATRSAREARLWLRDHAGVSYWRWLLGRLPDGIYVRYV